MGSGREKGELRRACEHCFKNLIPVYQLPPSPFLSRIPLVARSLFRSSSLTESLEQANGKASNIDISTENAMLQTILSTNMTEHVITQIKGNLVTVTATELV